MKKLLALAAVVGSFVVVIRRIWAGKAEQALWAEATDEV